MSDTVRACPECDSTALDRKTGTERVKWGCRVCGHRFRDANVRPPKVTGKFRSGLARRLADASPEEVGL